MALGPITSCQIDGETVSVFYFFGSKITADGNSSQEIKRWLLLRRKVTTNLDSIFGEGNGNPVQCSCLEYPRDRGAWWAAVYGVTQSQTLFFGAPKSLQMVIAAMKLKDTYFFKGKL